MKKTNLYRIGEISHLLEISVQTLRYYEKIELIKPALIDPETRYRYYDKKQLYEILLIRNFKMVGYSLLEIKDFMSRANADETAAFYLEKLKEIRKKIQRLKCTEETTAACYQTLTTGLRKARTSKNKMVLKKINDRMIVFARKILPFDFDSRLVLFRDLLNEIRQNRLSVKSAYGLIVHEPYEALIQKSGADFEMYIGIKKMNANCFSGQNLIPSIRKIPGGLYVTAVHQGTYQSSLDLYGKMKEWIFENQYEISGSVIQQYLVAIAESKSHDQVVFEIQIPVVKKRTD